MSDSHSPEKPPVRVWRRAGIGLACLVLILVIVALIASRLEHARATGTLEALMARLDDEDPHWRLADIEAHRKDIPDHENGARVIVEIVRLTPPGWPGIGFDAPFDKVAPQERLPDDLAAKLQTKMAAAPDVVAHARQLAEMPRGRFAIAHAFNTLETLLPNAQNAREAAQVARFEAARLAHHGDIDGALRLGRCGLHAGRAFGDEPFAISQMVRNAAVHIACNSIERTLAQGEATEAELARVQHALALEDEHPSFRVAARGERAMRHDLLEKLARGDIHAGRLWRELNGPSTPWWEEWLVTRVTRRDQAEYLRVLTEYVESTHLPEADRLTEERRIHAALPGKSHSRLLAELIPAMLKVGESCRRKHAYVRCLLVAVAVERYRLATGDWPDNLDALKPKYLATIPLDPHDGKSLRYTKTKEGVVVYTLGKDGTDDGGIVWPRPAADEGYRLWNVKQRRQPTKPPAPQPGEPPP